MLSFKNTALSALAVASHVQAFPTKARIIERQVDVAEEYDYVIVGGGTSGLTVGDRLTEDGESTVLVIEYGVYHGQTAMHPSRMFNITSQPSPALNNRRFSVGLGCGVGGSSLVNGQVMLRGTKEEYDAWKELGGPDSDWDWEGLLPYFKKGITLNPPPQAVADEFNVAWDEAYWGDETPIYATYGSGKPANITKDLYAAMASIPGVNIPGDSGAGENGLYWYSTSHDPRTQLRSYARTGHWDNVPRDNYELVVGAKVNQILFDDDLNATGVQFVSLNSTTAEPVVVKARKEVIIAAGSVHTPQVLMLSGIGPKAALEDLDIPVKVDLPGVGSNFQDHSYIPSISFQWRRPPTGGGPPLGGLTSQPNLVAMLGLPVLAPDTYEDLAQRYEDQDPTSHLPASYTAEQIEGYRQQQAVFSRLIRSPDTTFNEMMMGGPGGSIQNLHPLSRGTVRLDPANPEGTVLVDYRAGSNELDLEVMAEHIRFMRRYMTSAQFARYEPFETSPGATYDTIARLVQWSKGQIIPSVYHPIGTCAKVPRESGGCVDEKLRVYGTSRLSVIDGSIMPTNVGATTQMTVYAIAEKAADIIKARNA